MRQALEDAERDGAPLAVVRLDTPGGLDTSMRQIVRAVTGAPFPVVVHVTPQGARAASAGLFVAQAADVAVMAPQTNIGSASPVQIGGGQPDEVLGRKIENDAAAYVRALTETHGRNADLAERMVRDAVNVTAGEARSRDLVDLLAADEPALLAGLDGFRVQGPKATTLDTSGLTPERRDMGLRWDVQQLLVNPTVAYLLVLAGLLGLAFELLSPGLIGPGLFGAVSLVLGLYGTAQLPVNAAGVVLLALGVGLLVAELFVVSGVLGIAGVVALVAGGLLLYDTDSEVFRLSIPIAVAVGAALGGLTLFAAGKALAVRRGPPRDADTELVGRVATVRAALAPQGQVLVAGEVWRARTEDDRPLPAGARVRVRSREGLTLTVSPEPNDKEPS